MFRSLVISFCVGLFLCLNAGAEKLPTFGAEVGKKSMMGKTIRLPYTSLVSYWGYVKPGSEPDEMVDGKKMYYLYVWIPAVAPEIGVRMVSPGANYGNPGKDDMVSANWNEGADAKDSYFDTWINFERALSVINPEDIKTKVKSTKWIGYDSNDDSSELPAQPSGSKYNSLLRISSVPSEPTKALVRGLYRIAFTSYKAGEVEGTFMAQVGAPIALPGIIIEKDIDTLLSKTKTDKE